MGGLAERAAASSVRLEHRGSARDRGFLWRRVLEELMSLGNFGPPPAFQPRQFSGETLYTPPPPSPHFWLKGIFQGRGVGVYILRPHAAGILYPPPPFYTPPTPSRVFLGVGGWGCIKFGPVSSLDSEKLEKTGTVDFKKHPAQKVGTRSQAVSTQGSRQVCLSRCPKS